MKQPLLAWKVTVPFYRDAYIVAGESRDSVRSDTYQTLKHDGEHTPKWIDVRVTRAPEYDYLAAKAWKENIALVEINQRTGKSMICSWIDDIVQKSESVHRRLMREHNILIDQAVARIQAWRDAMTPEEKAAWEEHEKHCRRSLALGTMYSEFGAKQSFPHELSYIERSQNADRSE